MDNFTLHFLAFSLIFHCYLGGSIGKFAMAANQVGPMTFLRSSCRATLYPPLCVQSLSSYATSIQQNERQLAQAALSVSLAKAGSAAKFILRLTKAAGAKPREYQAAKDCAANMAVTVAQLKRSITELSQTTDNATRRNFAWRVGNVETWVSTAITNGNNCLFGFSGYDMNGNLKSAITPKVIDVVHVTSNALALVNNFAAKHKPNH